jgi:hypothetical protein
MHWVLTADSKPYEIARIGKTHNLTPSIGEHLVEGDGTGLNR